MAVGLTEEEYSIADAKLRQELSQAGRGLSDEERMNEQEMAEVDDELEEYEEAEDEDDAMDVDGDDEGQMVEDEQELDDDLSVIADAGTDFESSDEDGAGILTPSSGGDVDEDSWVNVRLGKNSASAKT
jgi:hypothetical protein